MAYALGGHEDIAAVAAFHGGINAVVDAENYVLPVAPKVLLLSGGEDGQDSTASIIKIEDILNERNATWQITRYSDVGHGFALGEAYDPYVGDRSHENFYTFVAEAFGETVFEADAPSIPGESIVPGVATSLLSPERTPLPEVKYSTDDGFAMTGYVAVPENASDEPLPAVVIIHDLSKPTSTEYESVRATMLADLGYVAFAADLFGDDDGGRDIPSETIPYLTELRVDDIDLANARVNAAIDAVKNLEGVNVDPDRIALTGYCFGGTVVINYATSGQSGAKGIVSFHGGLGQGVAPVEDGISAAMLIQSGGDDDAGSSIEDLEEAMKSGGTKWEYSRYSGVEHMFTVWDHQDYNARADVRSWEDMQTFLSDVFDGTLAVETDDSGVVDEAVEVGEVGEACPFCSGGLTVEETLAVPGADAGMTCGGLVEVTSTLEQGSEACKWALYGENICCPGAGGGEPSWPQGGVGGDETSGEPSWPQGGVGEDEPSITPGTDEIDAEGEEELHDKEHDSHDEEHDSHDEDSPEVESEPSATTKTSIAFSTAFSVILALAYHTHAL